jgi:multimeric flavodoxin WrbA
MKVVIINGSPKGKHSITLQYIRFLQKHFPAHEYHVVHVAQKIKALDKNEASFLKIIDEIRSSDLVLWSFGVWVLAVSAQLMRFIELIQERKASGVFQGKYAAALSTSIHYFDHTAHIYLRSVCEDLEMRFVDNLSFDIMDLKHPVGQRQILTFADYVFNAVEKKAPTSRYSQPLLFHSFDYRPEPATNRVELRGKKVLILTDRFQPATNLGRMINRFRAVFSGPVALIDLNDIDIKGACLGCMKCGYDYQCRYKDEFTRFYSSAGVLH